MLYRLKLVSQSHIFFIQLPQERTFDEKVTAFYWLGTLPDTHPKTPLSLALLKFRMDINNILLKFRIDFNLARDDGICSNNSQRFSFEIASQIKQKILAATKTMEIMATPLPAE